MAKTKRFQTAVYNYWMFRIKPADIAWPQSNQETEDLRRLEYGSKKYKEAKGKIPVFEPHGKCALIPNGVDDKTQRPKFKHQQTEFSG